MARVDPYMNFRFRVEIAGIEQAGLMECAGLGSQVEVVEYRQGSDPPTVRKLAGGLLSGYCSEMGRNRLTGTLQVALAGDPRKPG